MPITVVFSASQVVGSSQNIVITDSSTGSDVTAVSRRVTITNSANAYITAGPVVSTAATYTAWPLAAGNTLTLNALSEDSAYNITLAYLDVSGNVVATDTILSGFTLFNETFYYSLTQAQASQSSPPPIIQDTNYFSNKMQLRVLIDSGNQALELGADIVSAQNCYNMATAIVGKQNDLF